MLVCSGSSSGSSRARLPSSCSSAGESSSPIWPDFKGKVGQNLAQRRIIFLNISCTTYNEQGGNVLHGRTYVRVREALVTIATLFWNISISLRQGWWRSNVVSVSSNKLGYLEIEIEWIDCLIVRIGLLLETVRWSLGIYHGSLLTHRSQYHAFITKDSSPARVCSSNVSNS